MVSAGGTTGKWAYPKQEQGKESCHAIVADSVADKESGLQADQFGMTGHLADGCQHCTRANLIWIVLNDHQMALVLGHMHAYNIIHPPQCGLYLATGSIINITINMDSYISKFNIRHVVIPFLRMCIHYTNQ